MLSPLFGILHRYRALIETAAAPAFVHIHTAEAMANVTITPGHADPVNASTMVMTGDFGPLEANEVTPILFNPTASIESIRRPATKTGNGSWRVDDFNVSFGGKWSVRAEVLASDLEFVKLEDQIEIRL